MAAALSRFALRRPKRIVIVAGIALAVCAPVGATAFKALDPYESSDPDAESARAADALEEASGARADGTIIALVEAPPGTPEGRARIASAEATLRSVEGVVRVTGPLDPVDPAMVARDGRSAFVIGEVDADAESGALSEAAGEAFADRSDVELGGIVVADDQIAKQAESDLRLAELVAFPPALLLSLLFFRSLVAAALPLVLGGVGIVSALFAMRIMDEFVPLSVLALNVVTAIGLGLAIDYSLFIVSRYREELARGADPPQALETSLETSGRAVAFSGLTVGAAMAAMLVFPQQFIYSMGMGGIAVALLCCLAALLVLPAVLALLGERVNSLAPGWLQRSRRASDLPDRKGYWYRFSRWVMRHPATIAIVSAAALVLLAIPATRIEFAAVDADVLPDGQSAGRVDRAIADEFPADPQYPIIVQLPSSGLSPAQLSEYRDSLAGLSGVAAVSAPAPVGDTEARYDIVSTRGRATEGTRDVVREIRDTDAPAPIQVGGLAASTIDNVDSVAGHIPLAMSILVATTLILLFLMTGSVLLPFKALIMNLLTLGAAVGLMVLVFQDGRLEGLIGYRSQGGIQISILVLVFIAGFGLSTDYGVFGLSRIREAYYNGASNEEAVALGLERTGRLVTSAALLFAVATGALMVGSLIGVKEIGFGVAAAVLIDAMIVRGLLVPSLMALLGERNWWAPKQLGSLAAKPHA
ncbi:MAG: MMPL family transporter [Solirubrobacterales bacterium]